MFDLVLGAIVAVCLAAYLRTRCFIPKSSDLLRRPLPLRGRTHG